MNPMLADRLERLSPKQRALLEQRLRERQAERPQERILPRPESLAELPLSLTQERLWFLDQLAPGSSAYNIPAAVRFLGRLDARRLESSLNAVVSRHESLRTTFTALRGEPTQRIAEPCHRVLPRVDLTGLGGEAPEREALRLVAEEAGRTFDLERGPLLRVTLVRLGREEHILLLTLHHIVSDGWSIRLLIRELTTLYRAALDGLSPAEVLPPLAVQYADFSLWQRERLRGELLEAELAYWRRRLEGAPAELELPGDRPRPSVASGRGGLRLREIPASRVPALKTLGEREEATFFMVLLAGLDALLYRYTGREDMVLGTDVANRNRPETEPLIGFFVNELVLRVDLSGDPDFRTLLARVREVALEAYAHQDLPFGRLVEELRPERHLSRTPLFQVLFTLHNLPTVQDGGRGPHGQLRVEALPRAQGSAKFDLSVEVRQGAAGLQVSAEYSADLFDPVTVDRLLGHFETLLAGACASPETRISRLPLLGAAERHQLLVEWNDSAAAFPEDLFHRLFDEQAAARPQAVAASCRGESRTYGELREETDHLARALAAEGLGLDHVVALLAERGLGFLTAMIGIFKAGGAYLPLDPRYPAPHLARVLAGGGARLAVVEKALLPLMEEVLTSLPQEIRPRLLELEELLSRPDRTTPPLAAPSPSSLAYVIFTSGSTGNPKGAMVQHRGMLNHLWAKIAALGLTASDRVAQTASQGFDISVWQLLAALLVGGRVHILPDEVAHEPARLADETDRQGITVLEAVPSLLRFLVEDLDTRAAGRPSMAALRWMIPTGEALPPELCRQWLRIFPRIPLLNAYGPTECSDDVSHHPVPDPPDPAESQVPIGRPVANLRLYVLDRGGEPLPIGVPGELFVGGAGVGRGYLHEGGRTAGVWVPDPFAGAAGARLYRTGDLARLRRDGSIDFLGRIDHQVKIRGHRIELGEIEAALSRHGGVREAVVLVDERLTGGKGLVACVARRAGADVAADELRGFLSGRLPEPMIPARFAFFEALPLTANSKVDRRELARTWREAAGAMPEPAASGPARTWTEELLAGIFAEVLRVESVGPEDGFFDLGGHSLLATQVVSRVRDAFGVDLPLRALFERPQVAALAREVEALLAAGRGLAVPPLRPVSRDADLPLSFAQERLWFLDRLAPGSTAYNLLSAVRIEGELNLGTLSRSWTELARRHETLRTTFPPRGEGGKPVQAVAPEPSFHLPLADLSALPAADAQDVARCLAEEHGGSPFDLTRGPLLRPLVLRLAPAAHVIVAAMHHIVSDGWSMQILVEDLVALYRAFLLSEPSPLPALPVQTADHATWQQSWLAGEVLEAELAYWREKLRGLPPRLELPTDRPRPSVQTDRGAVMPLRLNPETLAGLRRLALERGSTLFMVLLAAFQSLLSRLSGQGDLAVGTPIAGRNRREIEGLIGFFVNTLVLRVDVTGDPEFLALLDEVRKTALEAYAHQDLPFEKLVAELAPERTLAHTPLFQVLLVLQNAPPASFDLPGLSVTALPLRRATAKFELTLGLAETPDGWLAGGLEYSTDLFDAPTLARLAVHFEVLLAAVLASPRTRIPDLPLLSEPERHQLLAGWNDTAYEALSAPCLHERFAAQARRTPETVAVTAAGGALTYGELARRARRLARRLRGRGVGPDRRVGLFVERSPEMIVGLLGILEAGGAYVPLDPGSPPERLAFLAADAELSWLVTQESLRSRLSEVGAEVLLLDGPEERSEEDEEAEAGGRALPESLMYVIYTSGSTGRPKGVMVTHGNAAHLFEAARRRFDFGCEDVWTLFHSFAFDFSVWEIWGALLYGGRLVLVPWEAGRSPEAFRELLAREGVTVLNQTPSSFLHLLPHLGSGEGLALRYVIFGGEALEPQALGSWLARPGGPLAVNMYGITETTVHVTYRALGPEDRRTGVGSPIGRPLPGLCAVLLDRRGNPVPAGVPGEIHVAGLGVMRGYLGRPELTAERLVPDPFGGEPGGRLYRSGDLARQRPDGELEYLGRIDHQVKIRGFRIELGEIEAALSAHDKVREAAVLVAEDLAGGKGLVACVAGQAEAGELRSFLLDRLPEHMVPSRFALFESLPLTSNGKVDRKELARTWRELAGAPVKPIAGPTPRTWTEELLAGIFAEVLRAERVGPEDGFFDLGGHSLLATQVASRVRDAFGVDLPLRTLFEHPRVAALAGEIESLLAAGRGLTAPPLRPVPRDADLPLSFAQERLWFLDRLAPGSWTYNMPVALRFEGRLSVPALEAGLSALVMRHEALRTAFPEKEGRPIQKVSPASPVPLPVVDLSALPEARRREAALALSTEEARRPFDLERGPLLRATLLTLRAEENVALWTLHHIVGDGWSLGVLVREIGELYASSIEGRRPELPPLSVQYPDFVAWQRRCLSGGVLRAEVAHWRERLAGAPELLELPLDHPRPAVQSFRGAHLPAGLPPALTPRLASLASRHGATPFIVVLAALEAWLSRITRQHDLVVGSPIAGRTRSETEGLIGFFVNTLALRGDLSGDPAFTELIARTRAAALEAYAHQDLPFEKLVSELSPQRSLTHAPIFQVMLAFLNVQRVRLELPGVVWEPLAVEPGGSKFDLTLSLTDGTAGLSGSWEYARDLFEATTVERMAGHFARLLGGAVDHPESRLSELPLLSEAESHQLCLAWNDTGRRGFSGCVHELFERQARRTPEAVAVVFGTEKLTYAELAARAGRLAQNLRRLGVGPDILVGLLVERSLDMIVGVLGILQAGGAYVPLDPRYPADRLAFMLDDTRSPVLVTQAPLRDRLPAGSSEVVLLDGDEGIVDGTEEGTATAAGAPSEESLAYVIYTSGSTGRPKGVALSHGALRNLIDWHLATLLGGVPTLQFASLSFDASFHEMFACWGSGGTLVVVPEELRRDIPALSGLLVERRIEKAIFPVVVLQQLAELFADRQELPPLREITTTGERLQTNRAMAALLRRLPGCAFHNHYGPSETHVATAYTMSPDPGDWTVHPSIGRPIWNTSTYVLEPGLAPAPLGVAGDLYIGGACLARGYLGRPDLTAEKFVPDPFAGEPGARLYRTGDKVRLAASGDLEFLGRFDDQVKIRGFRIEPGEIEAALAGHPAVREAAVVVRESPAGERSLVAYAALEGGAEASVATLRDYLRGRLPEHMVPTAFMILEKLPLTPNGKVSRKDLPAPDRISSGAVLAPPRSELERALARLWCEVLDVDQVGTEDNFFDLGGHSMRLIEVQSRLRRTLGRDVSVVDLFRHPTIAALARFLAPPEAGARPAFPAPAAPLLSRTAGSDIAVIGLAGRFPGATDVETFWANLSAGVESISRFSEEEVAQAGLSAEQRSRPGHVRAAGIIDGINLFDAHFFGFAPREAEVLDPQHRLFLEIAWQALEDAGYAPKSTPVPVGVYAGSRTSGYAVNVLSRPDVVESLGSFSVEQALDKDYLATRVSYELDLKGPSFAIQTACSTSLVAIHVACRALVQGECGMALAGGVALRVPDRAGYLYREGGVLSPDGRCRTFDAAAQGTVPGSGAGVVVLKRLEDALRDGDTIHAVVKGTAINNDGAVKVGFAAPSIEGQTQVISSALATGGISPDSVQYVEAHGTATPLGDPIEVAALTRAFQASTDRTGFCALGSVKTNLGHLDAAAGVAGFIKTVLALENRQIPPSLHFERPNPKIDFAASPFFVNTALSPWPAGSTPRRAGVSSFGIGGTNAHAVLEEAPPATPSGSSRPWQLLLVSARTAAALDEATANLARFLSSLPGESLADAAYTLKVGRQRFEHRRMLVCRTAGEAAAALAGKDPERVMTRNQSPARRPLVFLFPGQGAQHVDMGRGLYESEPVFQNELDACAERLLPRLGRDLRDLLYPSPQRRDEAAAELADTRWAQPALFAVEHALCRLWASWGIRPTAMIGHSLGEYVAACQAGIFSLEDALDLVAARGELMSGLPAGAMLSVDVPEAELSPWLAGTGLDMAAVNGPSGCVASGPREVVAALQGRLSEAGISCRQLHTSHAFHSAAMEPVLGLFREQVASKRLQAPAIPFLSGLTGAWITDSEATDPMHWVRGLRQTVRFGEGISRVLAETATDGVVLLEAGPGGTLGSLARRQVQPGKGHEVLASMRHPKSPENDQAALLGALGRLWLGGAEIDWSGFYREESRRRVRLPTYPFQRRRYWIDRPASVVSAPAPAPQEPEREAQATAGEPAPGYERPELANPFVAPGSDLERRLAAIWRDLLGTAEIGVHDNFFELGGHSLLATRVISRIREAFGLELPIDSLYDTPTLAGLAARIETAEPAGEAAPPLVPAPRSGPLPLSFAQQRLLYLQLLSLGEVAYNLPLGLCLSGPLDPAALAEALHRLEGRHEVLRTTFAVDEERVSQIVSPVTETGTLPWIDLSALARDAARAESRRIAVEDSVLPFDLLRGPVWRARLVRLEPEEHSLVLTLHHVAVDGWSYGILFREMVELYESLVEARQPHLPELPVQYADFALWQRSWLQGEILERLLGYWKRQLTGLPILDLPTDRPRPPVRTGRGGVRRRLVPPEEVEALRRIAQLEDATLFMALSAAFSVLLRRDSDSDDIVLGADIANRTRRETEGLIGLFVNQLVLRHDLSGDPSFRELLRRVRRVTLEAYAHQDAPFDKLVEVLNPPRDASRTPLFQIKIVLQNTPSSEARTLRGLSVSSLGLHNRTAKFDLLLNLTEGASGLICELEYSSDLYEPTTVDRLLDRFAAVIRTVTGQPDARLGELDQALGRSDLEAREEKARDRRSQAVSRVQRRRTTALVR